MQSSSVELGRLRLHYLQAGDPSLPPLLCLHGWPTNANLYRHVLSALHQDRHVIAIDLPGFGKSGPPTDRFNFRYLDDVLTGFVNELGFDELGLVVHDLGGPIGMHWAVHNPGRIRELVLLNTLVYSDFHWAVALFVAGLKLPLAHHFLTSPRGVEFAMRFGVHNKHRITPEVARLYTDSCRSRKQRRLLRQSGSPLSMSGFRRIEAGLAKLEDVPSALIYGENDRILPDVALTMARLHRAWPQSRLTPIPNAAHFVQEDRPDALAEALLDFIRR